MTKRAYRIWHFILSWGILFWFLRWYYSKMDLTDAPPGSEFVAGFILGFCFIGVAKWIANVLLKTLMLFNKDFLSLKIEWDRQTEIEAARRRAKERQVKA